MSGLLTGRHVMVDLETLGTGKSAAWLQVGACEFFPEEDRIGLLFNMYVDMGSSFAAQRAVDPGAFMYWLADAPADARERMVAGLRDAPSLVEVLHALADFCRTSNGQRGLGKKSAEPDGVWGHGAAFDCAMVEDTYAAMSLKCPFGHRAIRDTRTIFSLGDISLSNYCQYGDMREKWPATAPPHVAHCGLSDSIAQSLAVMAAARKLQRVS